MTPAPEVVVYTKNICGYCVAAKSLLREKGVAFREVNVSDNPAELTRMVERTKRRTLPQIFVGERHVGGFDDLAALNASGQLEVVLGISRG